MAQKEAIENKLSTEKSRYEAAMAKYNHTKSLAEAADQEFQDAYVAAENASADVRAAEHYCSIKEKDCINWPHHMRNECESVNDKACKVLPVKRQNVLNSRIELEQAKGRRNNAYANRDLAMVLMNSSNAELNAAARELRNVRLRIKELENDIAELEAKEKLLQEIVGNISEINIHLFASFGPAADISQTLDSWRNLILNLEAIEEPRKQLEEQFNQAGIRNRTSENMKIERNIIELAEQKITQIILKFNLQWKHVEIQQNNETTMINVSGER
jgi:hypothetical protein